MEANQLKHEIITTYIKLLYDNKYIQYNRINMIIYHI